MSKTKILDINIEADVLTSGSIAEVVSGIFELLLYQRNQIPLVYKTLKYYVENWPEDEENVNDSTFSLNHYHVQRQRTTIKQTKADISAMRQLIYNSFQSGAISSLRFLFGATTFTPKECYTIHIPLKSISHKHIHEHHRIPHSQLNRTLLNLLTHEELLGTFSENLAPTNLYLECEMHEKACKKDAPFFPKDFSRLPPSCKDIHLRLVHLRPPNLEMRCCKELQIYGSEMNDCESDDHAEIESNNTSHGWWEANVVVRGFKEKPIKDINLWTS